MKKLILFALVLIFCSCEGQSKKLIVEPGINHKPCDPIGNSKPMERLVFPTEKITGTLNFNSINFSESELEEILRINPYNYRLVDTNEIGIRTVIPTHSFVFKKDSLIFCIDFEGDSLVVSGDIPMSKSAEMFVDWCRQYTKTKVDSLQEENNRLNELLKVKLK